MHKFVLSTVVALFAVTLNVVAQSPELDAAKVLEALEKKGIITAADKADIIAEATVESIDTRIDEMVASMSAIPAVSSSHEPGRGVTFTDGPFSLTLRGAIQARFDLADVDIPGVDTDTEVGFNIPRVRVWIEGMAYENWSYEVEVDLAGALTTTSSTVFDSSGAATGNTAAGSTQTRLAELQDAKITWHNNGGKELMVSVGQFKAPYGRSTLTEFNELQFTDRNGLVNGLAPGRQIGIMIHGHAGGENGDLIDYAVGIFNGEGKNFSNLDFTGMSTFNFGGNDDEGFMYVGRIQVNPMGGMALTESDMRAEGSRDFIVQIGFNAFYDTNDATGQEDPFGIGADVAIFVEGLFGLVQFDYAENAFETEIISFLVQLGYMVVPGEFEIAARFHYGDFDFGGGVEADGTEFGGIATYFLAGHNAKVSLEILYQDLEAAVAGAGADVENILVRIQITLLF